MHHHDITAGRGHNELRLVWRQGGSHEITGLKEDLVGHDSIIRVPKVKVNISALLQNSSPMGGHY